MANIDIPSIGAIIPTVKGRKIAYAIFAAVSFVAGNTVVFFAATVGQVPLWLIGVTAVITNSAPAFSAIAIANATESVSQVEVPDATVQAVARHAATESLAGPVS